MASNKENAQEIEVYARQGVKFWVNIQEFFMLRQLAASFYLAPEMFDDICQNYEFEVPAPKFELDPKACQIKWATAKLERLKPYCAVIRRNVHENEFTMTPTTSWDSGDETSETELLDAQIFSDSEEESAE